MTSLLDFDLSMAQPLLGIDEVGLGCVAGPIVGAGVVLPDDYVLKQLLLDCGVKDSKRLSPSKRESALEAIVSSGASLFISVVSANDIDRFGLPVCIDRMYREVITKSLTNSVVRTILLDGSRRPNTPYSIKTVIKGDDKSLAIAAASIVAKQHRDQLMTKFCEQEEFRGYGWSKNKGYPTADHVDSIRRLGPSSKHRMSTKTLTPYRSSSITPSGRALLIGEDSA